jgi:hypothetical protein
MLWWRRMDINWTDRLRNDKVLYRVKRYRNILHKRKGKANWIGYILRWNSLLEYVTEGKIKERIEVTGRRIKT